MLFRSEAPEVSAMEEAAAGAAESVIEDVSGEWSAAEQAEETLSIFAEEAEANLVPPAALPQDAAEDVLSAVSDAESVIDSFAEEIASAASGVDAAISNAFGDRVPEMPEETESERKFRSITESLGGTISKPFVPAAQVMC